MYNRYIPQSDGTFRRSHVPDRPSSPPSKQRQEGSAPIEKNQAQEPCVPERIEQESQHKPPTNVPSCPCGKNCCPSSPPRNSQRKNHEPDSCIDNRRDGNVLDFLRNLLPKDFDTGDLLVVLLLLLMAGDCKEDQNSALLTLVLYLFM